MKDIDEIIFSLLLLDGNEASELSVDAYRQFKQLIIETVKAKYDVRWCSNLHCSCWPESSIKHLIEKEELKEFLFRCDLYDQLSDISNNVSDKTVWDDDGNHIRSGKKYL